MSATCLLLVAALGLGDFVTEPMSVEVRVDGVEYVFEIEFSSPYSGRATAYAVDLEAGPVRVDIEFVVDYGAGSDALLFAPGITVRNDSNQSVELAIEATTDLQGKNCGTLGCPSPDHLAFANNLSGYCRSAGGFSALDSTPFMVFSIDETTVAEFFATSGGVDCNEAGAWSLGTDQGCGLREAPLVAATVKAHYNCALGAESGFSSSGVLFFEVGEWWPGWIDCLERGFDAQNLGELLGVWGTANAIYDLDDSGVVDAEDLGLLLSAWKSTD